MFNLYNSFVFWDRSGFYPTQEFPYLDLSLSRFFNIMVLLQVHTQILYGLNDFMSCIMHLLTKNDSIQEQEKCGFPSLFHSNKSRFKIKKTLAMAGFDCAKKTVCHPIFSWANCLRILGTKKHEKRGHIHCFYFSWFSTKNYGLEPVSTIVNRFKCSIFLILRLTVHTLPAVEPRQSVSSIHWCMEITLWRGFIFLAGLI